MSDILDKIKELIEVEYGLAVSKINEIKPGKQATVYKVICAEDSFVLKVMENQELNIGRIKIASEIASNKGPLVGIITSGLVFK